MSAPRLLWERLGTVALIWAAGSMGAAAAEPTPHSAAAGASYAGVLPDGALWRARVPAQWNGTLLLYSHGYAPQLQPPQLAPRGLEEWLLAHGYALAASSYSQAGWALAQAVPDQRATLAVATSRIGTPRITLAWGDSMGGLVTTALAETAGVPIDGAVSACGSIAGTLAMMNTALDGAVAFVTLEAPDAGIQLVGVTDDSANAARVRAALTLALQTPQGRARVALAGVLGGLPVWSNPSAAAPSPDDYAAQLDQMAQALSAGLFAPRTDQERRAGGVFSWTTGIDYRAQLRRSGRWDWVERFYRAARLDLTKDLQRLNAAPRIAAQPAAIAYMRRHYAPTARPLVPFLTLHTIGDGLTSEVLQAGYSQAASGEGRAANYRAASVQAAGHCRFSVGEYVAAVRTVELRLREGRWSADPATLNSRIATAGLGAGRFVAHRSAPLLRACWASTPRCAGEPAR
ncbi:MAG TPA: hypothetical protein VHW25_12390 [Steroidobacteraceae bacterium]|jgi:hypothetical protein|nr:hypothetical protein [Steroidobacteraceae bacterium]